MRVDRLRLLVLILTCDAGRHIHDVAARLPHELGDDFDPYVDRART